MCYLASIFIILVVVFSFHRSAYGADETHRLNSVVDKAFLEYEKADPQAAIEYLYSQSDPLFVMKSIRAAMREAYWKRKDMEATLMFGRAGYQYGMIRGRIGDNGSTNMAQELRSGAKGFLYDIASFTWPGWDEKGIVLNDTLVREGLNCAKANLRLAIEMKKEPIAMSRAHWILGAQELAHKRFEDAKHSFVEASKFAGLAQSQGDQCLAGAFECLTEYLSSGKKRSVLERLEILVGQLRELEDGEFFANQVDVARRVFE